MTARAVTAAVVLALLAGGCKKKPRQPDVALPQSEAAFIAAVTTARRSFQRTDDESAKTAARNKRAVDVKAALGGGRRFQGWLGTLRAIRTAGGDRRYAVIEIAPAIQLTGRHRLLADDEDYTLIDAGTPMAEALAELRPGDPVEVSGDFVDAGGDWVREASLTQNGSMLDPEFVASVWSIRLPGRPPLPAPPVPVPGTAPTRVRAAPAAAAAAAAAEAPELPPQQAAFVAAVEGMIESYQGAANELQASALRTRRAAVIKAVLRGKRTFKNWQGTLVGLTTTGAGHACVDVRIAPHTRIQTWNSDLADGDDKTVIAQSHPLFAALAELKQGDAVEVSGTFLPGKRDFVRESSVTEDGAMTDPEFIVRFSAVTRHR
jgi:hypothetical protein